MSFSSMKKSNSLDKLLGAVETENKPQEKKSYVDERIWKPTMDKTGNGFVSFVFFLFLRVKKYLGQKYGIMFQEQQDSGILRTLSLLLDRMIQYQNIILNSLELWC